MKTHIITAKELDEGLRQQWLLLQQADPQFLSPFFCPEFTATLGAHRDDIFVALIEDENTIVGFFPFMLGKHSIALPMPMCDYEGIILKKGVIVDLKNLLYQCKLAAWDFDHLIASSYVLPQLTFGQVHTIQTIDLEQGFESYGNHLRSKTSKTIKGVFGVMRKLEREIGAITFEPEIHDITALHTLLKWKASKYNAGHEYEQWIIKTLESFHTIQKPHFKGVLSGLYANNELIAAHFGMRSGKLLHYWFPAYNRAYDKYSPGTLLLLRMAEALCALGITSIDLGAGDEGYKVRFGNKAVSVVRGSVETLSYSTAARRIQRNAKRLLRRFPLFHRFAKKIYNSLRAS